MVSTRTSGLGRGRNVLELPAYTCSAAFVRVPGAESHQAWCNLSSYHHKITMRQRRPDHQARVGQTGYFLPAELLDHAHVSKPHEYLAPTARHAGQGNAGAQAGVVEQPLDSTASTAPYTAKHAQLHCVCVHTHSTLNLDSGEIQRYLRCHLVPGAKRVSIRDRSSDAVQCTK